MTWDGCILADRIKKILIFAMVSEDVEDKANPLGKRDRVIQCDAMWYSEIVSFMIYYVHTF